MHRKWVWSRCAGWFPSLPMWNVATTDLERRIKFWCTWLNRSDKPHVSSIIPCLVLWFIWSERNNKIHRGTTFTAETVIFRTQQYLQQLVTSGKLGKAQWSGCDLCDNLDTTSWKEKPWKQIKLIRWIPPDIGWLKLNVDGVWNFAGAGAGGILRDEGGNIIYGFKTKVVASSRTDATIQAVCIGLNMAMGRGQQIWLEIGEQGAARVLTERRYGAAMLRHQLTEVRNKLKEMSTKISHIAKEGNKVANHLAQQGCNMAQLEHFDHHSATRMVMAMVRMEQLGVPNFQFCS